MNTYNDCIKTETGTTCRKYMFDVSEIYSFRHLIESLFSYGSNKTLAFARNESLPTFGLAATLLSTGKCETADDYHARIQLLLEDAVSLPCVCAIILLVLLVVILCHVRLGYR